MGFSGLSHWVDSDNAADFVYDIDSFLEKKILTHIKRKSNEYNTDGATDIALMINSDYFPISNWKKFNSDLVDEIQIKLEERLEDFKEDGWKMGISCIEKALKKLKD